MNAREWLSVTTDFHREPPAIGNPREREKGNEAKTSNNVRLNGNIARRRPGDEMIKY